LYTAVREDECLKKPVARQVVAKHLPPGNLQRIRALPKGSASTLTFKIPNEVTVEQYYRSKGRRCAP
jgi:hypothetical protein